MATLDLNEAERARLEAWNAEHVMNHHGGKKLYAGPIGGRVSFTIVPTSVGTIVKATCALCEKQGDGVSTVDLTDYSTW